MTEQNVLIVDDEPDIRELLEITLSRMGLRTTSAANLAEARQLLAGDPPQLCLTDMRLPDGNGIDLVRHIQQAFPRLPVAMITAHGSIDAAIEALKAGAFDFISKPVDLDGLRRLVEQALQAPPEEEAGDEGGIIGDTPAIRTLRQQVDKLARSQAPVHIHGESGTGKEVVARQIHARGPRAGGPFVAVNCGAIPENLVESTLFGHEKGAFTGATNSKPGRFELAHEGTLFLDEIGEVSTEMQVKLLRAIQESEFERVGGVSTKRVDVRLVTATNRDLASEVQAGRFREDLFYRLNVVPVRLPPLRERREDIGLLAEHLLEKYSKRLNKPPVRLAAQALDVLQAYDWPGNIRELENVLERTLLFCEGDVIDVDALPSELQLPTKLPSGPLAMDLPAGITDLKGAVRLITRRIEREMIDRALEETGRNVTRTARQLGISRKSLQTKMKELSLRED